AKSAELVVAIGTGKKGAAIDAADLAAQLRQRGIAVEELTSASAVQAAANVAAAVGGSKKLGVLLTDHPAAALCIANRQRGVRAAPAANRGELNDLMQNLGVNLLVVDAVRRSRAEIQRLIEAFAAASPSDCPADLKQWLD